LVAILEWAATFTFMIVTYDAILVGSVVSIWLVNVVDVVIPFASATAEFTMFSVLAGVPWGQGRSAELAHTRYWFLALAVFGFLSGALVANAYLNVGRYFAVEVAAAIKQYKNGLIADFSSAVFVIGAGGLVFFYFARHFHWVAIHAQRFAAAAAFLVAITALISQERARLKLWRSVRRA
jgi:hypothetical protein